MSKKENKKFYYHFVSDTLRDGRPVPADGEWLETGDESKREAAQAAAWDAAAKRFKDAVDAKFKELGVNV